jgi:hypothetical protein
MSNPILAVLKIIGNLFQRATYLANAAVFKGIHRESKTLHCLRINSEAEGPRHLIRESIEVKEVK